MITLQQKTYIQQAILADEVAHVGYIPLRDANGLLIDPRKYNGTTAPKNLYQALFGLQSAKIKVPAEMFDSNMRSWLDSCLLKICYNNIFQSHIGQQEVDTYTEICTMEPKDMEWGVVQKVISLLLALSAEHYPIDEEIKKAKRCYHDKHGMEQLQYKTCPICHGEGFSTNKPGDDKLRLLSYNKIVKNIVAISLYINQQIEKTENDVVNSIWNDLLNERDKMSIDNTINKVMKEQNGAQGMGNVRQIPVPGAFGKK